MLLVLIGAVILGVATKSVGIFFGVLLVGIGIIAECHK